MSSRNPNQGEIERIKGRIARLDTKKKILPIQRFDLSANTPGQDTLIAEYRVVRPLAFQKNKPLRIAVTAHQTYTTDSTAGNSETISLDNDLVDSPSTQSVLLFEEGEEVEPDAVDYAANTVTYTDDGTGNTLDIYYTFGGAGTVTVEKAPTGKRTRSAQEVYSSNTLIANTRDPKDAPLRMNVGKDDFHPVVPSQFYIRVYLDSPAQFRGPQDRANGTARPDNFRMDFPIKQAQSPVDGLENAVKVAMADERRY